MDNVTEQRHQQALMIDQRFITDFQELNQRPFQTKGAGVLQEDAQGQDRARKYCISIENQAIAAIQNGNLPEVSFQLSRLDDVNRNTLGKIYVKEREGLGPYRTFVCADSKEIDKHRSAISNISCAPIELRNYRVRQFLTDRRSN